MYRQGSVHKKLKKILGSDFVETSSLALSYQAAQSNKRMLSPLATLDNI